MDRLLLAGVVERVADDGEDARVVGGQRHRHGVGESFPVGDEHGRIEVGDGPLTVTRGWIGLRHLGLAQPPRHGLAVRQ